MEQNHRRPVEAGITYPTFMTARIDLLDCTERVLTTTSG